MQKRARAKQDEPKRTVVTTVRFTEDERDAVNSKAEEASMLLSDYIRQQSLKGRVIVHQEPEQTDLPMDVFDELRRIGVNLNQIAKSANSGQGVSPALGPMIDRLNGIIMSHIERNLPEDW